MSGKIFISYRRDDSRYQARMIYEAFLRRMPRENVFMDIDTIPPHACVSLTTQTPSVMSQLNSLVSVLTQESLVR
jgi:hypothetical protein